MKTSKFYITLCLLLCPFWCFSQTYFDWVSQLGNTSATTPSSISIDNEDYIYSTGTFSGTLNLKNQSISSEGGGKYAYITLNNKINRLLWFTAIGDKDGSTEGTNICADKAGSVYVSGNYSGKTSIGDNSYSTTGNKASFLAKYSATGELIWTKNFDSTDEFIIKSVNADQLGNVYLAGYTKGNATIGNEVINSTQNKAFIINLNSQGDIQWFINTENIDSSSSEANKIISDNAGNSYFIGNFKGNIKIKDKTLSSTSINSFVVKTKISGEIAWINQLGGSQDDILSSIAFRNKHIAIAGNLNSTDGQIKGENNVNLISTGKKKAMAVLFDTEGKHVWNYIIGDGVNGNEGNSVTIDNQNMIYFGGGCSGTVNFNPNGEAISPTGKGGMDMFVVKMDITGNILFASRYGGSTTEEVIDIAVSEDDNRLYTLSEFKRRTSGSTSYTKANFAMHDKEYEVVVSGASINSILTMYSVPQIITRSVSAIKDKKITDCLYQIGGNLVTYSLLEGSLPAGVILNEKGSFEGISTEKGTFNIKVGITLKENDYSQIYQDIKLTVEDGSSIDEEKNENNKNISFVYPNPNNGKFFLKIPETFGNSNFSVEIYGLNGKIIKKIESYKNEETIELNNISKGMYLINIKSENALILSQIFIAR